MHDRLDGVVVDDRLGLRFDLGLDLILVAECVQAGGAPAYELLDHVHDVQLGTVGVRHLDGLTHRPIGMLGTVAGHMTLLNITYLAGWSVVLTWSLPQRISRANAMTPQVLSAETTDMPIGSVPDWPAAIGGEVVCQSDTRHLRPSAKTTTIVRCARGSAPQLAEGRNNSRRPDAGDPAGTSGARHQGCCRAGGVTDPVGGPARSRLDERTVRRLRTAKVVLPRRCGRGPRQSRARAVRRRR